MNKSQKNRIFMIAAGAVIAGAALYLSIDALSDKASLFKSPGEISEMSDLDKTGKTIRIGGLVSEGSVQVAEQGGFYFTVSDFQSEVPVYYSGLLPDLFREGQGVYIDGSFNEEGKLFIAKEVLAKHDEKYTPPLPGEGE